MKVLVACEYSGIVRDAFAAKGHDAWSCDLLPTEKPGPHIQGDAIEAIYSQHWDLLIGHPPCTYLSYVGNRHWDNPGRARLRLEGLDFFLRMWEAPIEKICLENPMGVIDRVITKHHQIVQPYYFGDSQMKTTCLWLKNLDQLKHSPVTTMFEQATHVPKPEPMYFLKTNGKAIHWTEAIKGGKKRSKFWPGIANAMADQWG
jgi:site-specific DNA-cytosine methylase